MVKLQAVLKEILVKKETCVLLQVNIFSLPITLFIKPPAQCALGVTRVWLLVTLSGTKSQLLVALSHN